ncbi:uncharacterized protein ISCGN_006744 [Ixodes scapularis]
MKDPLEAINLPQGMGLLLASRACPECEAAMTLQVRARSADCYSWRCGVWMPREVPKRKPVKVQCRGEVSVRSGFFFEESHLTLPQLMKIICLWCQNLPCAIIQRETDVCDKNRGTGGHQRARFGPRRRESRNTAPRSCRHAALYGRLEPFEGDGSAWPVYEEQVHVFFRANDTPEAKQRDIFLASCGTRVFSLLLDLLKPATPHVKTLGELLATLRSHFSPAPSTLMERFRFNNRSRQDGETLGQFVAALRGLASTCAFGDQLDSLLRDRFVCGINNPAMQTRLLELPDPSLDDAVKAALAMEAAAKDASEIARAAGSPSTEATVNKMAARSGACSRCGAAHSPSQCQFVQAQCFTFSDGRITADQGNRMQLSFAVLLVLVAVAVAKDFSGGFNSKPTSPDCPVPGSPALAYVADPNDCTKYSICSDKISVKVDCPFGQCFNGAVCNTDCVDCTPAPPPGPPAGVAAVAADDAE